MRYLDRYEKLHFLGEDNDRNNDEGDDDNRHKKWNNKNLNEIPLKYNYAQHNVSGMFHTIIHVFFYSFMILLFRLWFILIFAISISESLRVQNKLSTDLFRPSEYDRLLMSLMSPLPNEQDFAINVCTLMANESKHTLKVEHCPKLVDALLGHAGIYSHCKCFFLK